MDGCEVCGPADEYLAFVYQGMTDMVLSEIKLLDLIAVMKFDPKL